MISSVLLLASCPDGNDNKTPGTPSEKEKTYADFDTWNEWLAHKYNKEFGWDALSGLGSLKAPITHDMLAEEYFFAKGLNAGWNLGNTHDLNNNPRADSGHYEKLLPGVKAAGFNVMRIPVTWGSTATGTGHNTELSEALLDQVEQAVIAAHNAGLVVFINSHHDKAFFNLNLAGASYNASGENGVDFVSYTNRYIAVWTQIAARFKDYGEWLLFESINEPTITDSSGTIRWDGAEPEYHEVINRWNQAFVDTVRESGGNNEKRYLIFKSYAAKLQPSLVPANGFRIPTDPAGEGRLVYSFHLYVPQPLALEGQNANWSSGQSVVFSGPFGQARGAYLVKNIPVFMGETGATFHSQRTGEDSITANKNRILMLNALGAEARKYGIIPCLWDNGEATRNAYANQPNGETFALFRRKAAHDDDFNNWGLPIDHTKVAGGSNVGSTGGNEMAAGNAAYDDPDFGAYTIKAFIEAVNGITSKNDPAFPPKLAEKLGL